MRHLAFAALLALSACASATAQPQAAACTPLGASRADLDALKAAQWAMPDDARRNAFALALAECVGDPDPAVRDGVAFEGLQHWMRNRQLTNETMLALNASLQAKLTGPEGDGYTRPFAALVLAEVARADRVEAYLTPAQRAGLLDASIAYLTGVRDYRGFDAREGWRHGVAHGADLMLQLTLNPAFEKPELTRIRDAIASQIAPGGHAYVFGESERLATPILYMARRNVFTADEWTAWFTQLAGTETDWRAARFTAEGQVRRHNLQAFLNVIYVNGDMNGAPFDVLVPGAVAAMRIVP